MCPVLLTRTNGLAPDSRRSYRIEFTICRGYFDRRILMFAGDERPTVY